MIVAAAMLAVGAAPVASTLELQIAMAAPLRALPPASAEGSFYDLGSGFDGKRCLYDFHHGDIIWERVNLGGDLRKFFGDRRAPVRILTTARSRQACTLAAVRALRRAGFRPIEILHDGEW
jgi:hypothetical protein